MAHVNDQGTAGSSDALRDDPMAGYYLGAASALLEDLRGIDLGTASDRDLCRMIGRTDAVLDALLRAFGRMS